MLGIAFYPFGPKLVRLAWHATHQANISYAGARVPIPREWFVYHSRDKLIVVRAEAIFARNMFDIGYAYLNPPDLIVLFETYKESLRRRKNSKVFSHGGLEFACTDWDEPPTGFVNSCLVQDKFDINFAGQDRYRPDFSNLVHGMTACPVENIRNRRVVHSSRLLACVGQLHTGAKPALCPGRGLAAPAR